MVPYHAFFHALIQAKLYDSMSAAEKKRFTKQLQVTERLLKECVDRMPDNFRKLHTLIAAECARMREDFLVADRLYQQALENSMDGRYLWIVGITGECAGRFYLERKEVTKAVKSLHVARNAFASWGAVEKVKRLEFRYPQFFGPKRPTEPAPQEEHELTTVEDVDSGDEFTTVDETDDSMTVELAVDFDLDDKQ